MGSTGVGPGVAMLQDEGVPHYILPEWACRAFADLRRATDACDGPELPRGADDLPPDRAAAAAAVIDRSPPGYLPERAVLAVLAAYGLPVPRVEFARSRDQAVAAAGRVGFPAVLRVVSPDVVHKTEAGGVRLDLSTAAEVAAAFDEMTRDVRRAVPAAAIDGVIVRRMLPDGHEVIIGGQRDRAFGPVVMFGLGGTYVELFQDVVFAAAPVGIGGARRLIDRTAASRLLAGLRGAAACDLPAVARHVAAVSELLADFERIVELDVNPLICWPGRRGACGESCGVADARIRLA
jgi:acetyltransferase